MCYLQYVLQYVFFNQGAKWGELELEFIENTHICPDDEAIVGVCQTRLPFVSAAISGFLNISLAAIMSFSSTIEVRRCIELNRFLERLRRFPGLKSVLGVGSSVRAGEESEDLGLYKSCSS